MHGLKWEAKTDEGAESPESGILAYETPAFMRFLREHRNTEWNGIKRRGSIDERIGYFGVINLLSPRSTLQRPFSKYWNDAFTYVQLRYDFLTTTLPMQTARHHSPSVIVITLRPRLWYLAGCGAQPAIEIMQMGPQATSMETGSEIAQHSSYSAIPGITLQQWPSSTQCRIRSSGDPSSRPAPFTALVMTTRSTRISSRLFRRADRSWSCSSV